MLESFFFRRMDPVHASSFAIGLGAKIIIPSDRAVPVENRIVEPLYLCFARIIQHQDRFALLLRCF